ncbi:MAG: hypothetical protein WCJ53_12980, partial [Mycobacteriaceae bacterium]
MGPIAMQRLGYLGALTVALGIGAALTAEAPKAWADTTGDTSAAPADHTRASERRPAQRVADKRVSAIKATVSGVAKPTPAAHARRGFVAPGATAQPGLSITRSGQSPFILSSGSTGAAELSGITYAGGTTYYSVGDNGATTIWQIYTSLDSATGQIRSSLVTAGIHAPGMGIDAEGITLGPDGNNVWISD